MHQQLMMNEGLRYLKLEIIWKDDDMIELQVSANNGRYSGITEVYDQKEKLFEFANKLTGYPRSNEVLFHSAGEQNGYAYFEMKLFQIDSPGKVGVLITIEENVQTEFRESEKDKLRLELIVEPNSIDNFQNQLTRLAKTQEGSAELLGIEK